MKSSTPFEKKNRLLDTLAFLSLKHSGESTDEYNVIAESGRIERAIEYFYVRDPAKSKTSSLDYNEFVIDFVMKHYNEFVFGHGFIDHSDKTTNTVK